MKQVRFNNQSNSPREIGLFRQCIRFQPKERSPQPNEEDAMMYSKLRRFGLVRDKALKYCLADHCKFDASQCKHGPPNYKIFSTSLDKQKIIRGWQMVGKLKESSSEKFQKAKGDDGLMQYRNQEEQKKFERLKNYFLGLSNSSKQVKLPQFQMGNGKDHYFELADYYEQIKPLSRTLITDTESFDDIIPKQIREQFRIEPRVQRPALKRTDEEKGLKSRLKALHELIETYREAGSPNDPSIEIMLEQFNPKVDDERQRQEFPNIGLSKEQIFTDEGSATAKKRCSVLSHRFSKFQPFEEQRKNQQFQQKLDKLVTKVIGRINCKFDGTLFGKDFLNS
ncbi:unnamed protein product (macronuclear) [Paramecium tetraurelia]|uniref:Uncharacterized protein n=1 Tax=Paramecium tetraurelia TaxID=5888 RepID=A0D4E4_PARTE|nr:uncharacterized protein GSPATT00013377001 [Paramecium tetraurelia]CAK77911.1 unnamed protein product [Paramecium tetraurelia]|eukprot:XP_001445308.1 hypothetical protein (macronuclear) [Paramecium tetraurelia strain d4-2]